jgi:hypothetical protein
MDSALIDQTSEQFLGQWQRLVSTTNWEKGRIIHDWREALRGGDMPGSEYSDEAWSRRVGNVTPQHVGRLRRAYERFAAVRDDYPGLYWSHFQAALDWEDAEMWLEGAVQSDWSISQMRQQRWEATGQVAAEQSLEDESGPSAPWDEDAEAPAGVVSATLGVVRAPEAGDEAESRRSSRSRSESDHDGHDETAGYDAPEPPARREMVRPFADLPPLPPDVNDAFEAYKLCILRHKLAGWQEISRDDLLASLDSLKQLALAPADV